MMINLIASSISYNCRWKETFGLLKIKIGLIIAVVPFRSFFVLG